MQIRSTIEAVASKFRVRLETDGDNAITFEELEALAMFGEPLLQCGGTFGTGTNAFVLPENQIRFPSGLPVVQFFTELAHAEIFASEMLARMGALISSLRNNRHSVKNSLTSTVHTI